MRKSRKEDVAMLRIRDHFEKSGLSLHELGVKMGYPEETARKSAWQFLRQTDDPRISMLRRSAAAMGVSLHDLVGE